MYIPAFACFHFSALVDDGEIDDEISCTEDEDPYEHIEQAILDAFYLCWIIWFHQEFDGLDDDDDEDDE